MAGAASRACLNRSRTAGAHADDHLDEFAGAHAEERHVVRFTGHGSGQQGLAGVGRTDQQDAVGHHAAEADGLARFLRKPTSSTSSDLASSMPATSANVTPRSPIVVWS